jgi:hypothetical protein
MYKTEQMTQIQEDTSGRTEKNGAGVAIGRTVYLQQLYPPVDSCRLLVCAEVATKTQDLHVRERLLHEPQRHLRALQFKSNITPSDRLKTTTDCLVEE